MKRTRRQSLAGLASISQGSASLPQSTPIANVVYQSAQTASIPAPAPSPAPAPVQPTIPEYAPGTVIVSGDNGIEEPNFYAAPTPAPQSSNAALWVLAALAALSFMG